MNPTAGNAVEPATRNGDGLEVAPNRNRRSGCVRLDVLHLATARQRPSRPAQGAGSTRIRSATFVTPGTASAAAIA
jgi:hypothetical protein